MSKLNITQPLGISGLSIMATIFGDVQDSQVMGQLPTPDFCVIPGETVGLACSSRRTVTLKYI